MGTFFLILFITIINICAWIAFFIKLKNAFSTEGLIEETKAEINRIIKDIDRNTLRDINLVNEKLRELESKMLEAQSVISKVDDHIEIAKKQVMSNEFKELKETVGGASSNKGTSTRASRPRKPTRTSAKTFDPADRAYEVLQQGMPDLFDNIPTDDNTIANIPTSDGAVIVRNDGTSYAHVPVVEMKDIDIDFSNWNVSPAEAELIKNTQPFNIAPVETPIQEPPKPDFPAQVRALHIEGKDEMEIARILGCSPVEVELVLNI